MKIGQKVILQEPESSYFLPKELQSGTEATLLKSYYGTLTIEQGGKEWRISDRCIQHDMEFELKRNCWLPKDHPMTAAALAEELRRVQALRRAHRASA